MTRRVEQTGDSKRFLKAPSTELSPCPLLQFDSGSLAGKIVRLESGTMTLGRGTHNHLIVDDPGVSRSHCKLVILGTRVQLVDLKSTNGTYVEGQRIEEILLENGQQIVVGTGVLMTLTLPAPEEPTRPAPRPTAAQDPIAGLPTRQEWMKQAIQLITTTLGQGRPVSLAVCRLDVDPVSEAMLGELWQRIRALGAQLSVGRLANEELAMLLPDSTADAARALLERLLSEVESAPFQLPPDKSILVTASAGLVTALTVGQGKLEDLLRRAGEALQQARRSGRSRVQSLAAVIPVVTPTVVVATESLPLILTQKRRNSRTLCKTALVVRVQGRDHPGQMCDVGVGGLRMTTTVPLRPGDVVEIRLPQRPNSSVTAVVRWTHTCMAGLHFQDPPDRLRSSWVSQLLQHLGRNAESARERRAHARVLLDCPIKVAGSAGTYTATACNIGSGGVGAQSALAPPIGSVAEAEIADLQVKSRVIWVRGGHFGLQFAPLSAQQQSILLQLVKGRSHPPAQNPGFIPFE
ncbi:PilZ domain-containing protein [bacterium]|nr:PilZ domain-containing protein [bacterium]